MAKKKNIDKETMKQILGLLSEEDLRKFVERLLSKQEVKSAFLKDFGNYFTKHESADKWVSQIIDAYIDAVSEKGDYISFHSQSTLASKMIEIMEVAGKFRDKGNFEAAIDIYFQILDENTEAINNNDDSYGDLGTIMRGALDGLRELTDNDICTLDEDSRLYFIENCWDIIEEGIFDDWDWHVDMYDLLVELAREDDECENIFEAIDDDDYFDTEWHQTDRLRIKRNVLNKWKGADAAHAFVLANLDDKSFREETIKEALDADDFAGAYKLCTEAIDKEKEKGERIPTTWYQWMLRISQKEGNKEVIVESARMLYLDDFRMKDDYYGIIKANVPTGKWDEFMQRLAQDALNMRKKEKYADICAREGWKDRLYEHIREEREVSLWNQYHKALLPEYKDAVVDYFISHACGILNRHQLSRSSYQELCAYLTKAASAGGQDKVDVVREELARKHRNRPALLDELRRMTY